MELLWNAQLVVAPHLKSGNLSLFYRKFDERVERRRNKFREQQRGELVNYKLQCGSVSRGLLPAESKGLPAPLAQRKRPFLLMLLQTFVSAIFHHKVNMSSYKSCQRLMSLHEATPFPQFYLAAVEQKPTRAAWYWSVVCKTLAAHIC